MAANVLTEQILIGLMLSNGCRYAIKALIYLALRDEDGYRPLREISDEMSIPRHFLAKIVRPLVERGWLESARGPRGGVRLASLPSEITVREVIEEVDGADLFEECMLGLPGCGDEDPCPLHATWKPAKGRLRRELESTTVANLAVDVEASSLRLC